MHGCIGDLALLCRCRVWRQATWKEGRARKLQEPRLLPTALLQPRGSGLTSSSPSTTSGGNSACPRPALPMLASWVLGPGSPVCILLDEHWICGKALCTSSALGWRASLLPAYMLVSMLYAVDSTCSWQVACIPSP